MVRASARTGAVSCGDRGYRFRQGCRTDPVAQGVGSAARLYPVAGLANAVARPGFRVAVPSIPRTRRHFGARHIPVPAPPSAVDAPCAVRITALCIAVFGVGRKSRLLPRLASERIGRRASEGKPGAEQGVTDMDDDDPAYRLTGTPIG